jgi:hypothetical protein
MGCFSVVAVPLAVGGADGGTVSDTLVTESARFQADPRFLEAPTLLD